MTRRVGRFLEQERARAGWRFWLLWVAATNLGFFPGMALGWGAGAGLGAWLLVSFAPSVVPGGVGWTIAIGFFAGAVVGVPQAFELRRAGRALAARWVPISSLAWGVFFPGVVSGLVLARRLSREPGAGCAGGSSCPTPRSGSG